MEKESWYKFTINANEECWLKHVNLTSPDLEELPSDVFIPTVEEVEIRNNQSNYDPYTIGYLVTLKVIYGDSFVEKMYLYYDEKWLVPNKGVVTVEQRIIDLLNEHFILMGE